MVSTIKLGVAALSNTRILALAITSVLGGFLLIASASLGQDMTAPQGVGGLCGTTVTTNVKLTQDLSCAGNGLVVGANGVTIDLNGHTIAGSGPFRPFIGIAVSGWSNVTIRDGTVTMFRTGVTIVNSNHVKVKDLAAVGNGLAGSASGDGIRVLSSTDVKIKKVVVAGSGSDGIEIQGSAEVVVSHSTIRGGLAGIAFTGAPSTNTKIHKNWIRDNRCGIRGPTDGIALTENVFERNGSDFCA